ncbi:Ig-like domain-containing protein [Turneriella parva]|uniref:SbsA Ig-like domain-containing protein n=1 Tax=Turneriella parva (strain ATCC BAA-1111 / DSM 21527 / NCTC 11395 / H) TaxID=869212 RepID=I4B6W6_TURPD|nr:Ig-like domain-containing protein [Turneriella parva]AFM13023.1 hypothetical protein Turpa_2380 [Turneriella parva DSM 21527]
MKISCILVSTLFFLACSVKPQLDIVTLQRDLEPPRVLTVTPVNGTTQVTDLPRIEIVFSEAMDSNSLNSATIYLKKAGLNLGGTILYDAPSRKVTLTPAGRLSLNTEHTLTISTGVKDLAGNSLVSDFTSTFSTDSCPGPQASQPKLGFNNDVSAIAKIGCVIYVGGDFTSVGVETGGGVPLNTATGNIEFGVNHLPINGSVSAVVSDGAGGWYIGGTFTQVGAELRKNLAHVRSDGSLTAWNPGADLSVTALAISGDAVYIGGYFTTVAGAARSRAAAISTSGVLLPWNPNANGQVLALAVSGTTIFAGGNFTEIGGGTQSNLGALDAATGNLSGGHLNPSTNYEIYSLVVSGATLLVGGSFTCINTSNPAPACTGGTNRNRLAAFSLSGNLLNWAPTLNDSAHAISVSENIVYVGGSFSCYGTTNAGPTCTGGTNRNRLVAVDASANCLANWSGSCAQGGANPLQGWNPDADNLVRALSATDSAVYVGGNFTSIGVTARNRLAAVGKDGTVHAWNPNLNNYPFFIASGSNSIYVAGTFTTVNNQVRNRLAAISTDGVLQVWSPNANSTVRSIAATANSIIAGGDFSQINSTARNRLAAIAPDGTLLNFNPGANSSVLSLATGNGKLYAGGYFTTIAGQSRNRVAAFDLSTKQLLAWNPNAGDAVSTISISGSTVYIGGYFTGLNDNTTSCGTPGLVTRNRIAAVNDTDGCATSWNPNADSNVNAIAVLGAEIYAGGSFTTIGGGARTYLARLDAVTGMLLDNPASTGSIYSLVAGSNQIHAGGVFTTIGGIVRRYAGAVGSEGNVTPWNPNADMHVYALLIVGNVVYMGGGFTSIGGSPRSRFAMVNATDGSPIW